MVEQKLQNISLVCYEIENFTKNTFLRKIARLILVNIFPVNPLMHQG